MLRKPRTARSVGGVSISPRTWAGFPLRSIVAADLCALTTKLESTVSSVDHQRGVLSELSSILEAAVDDKRLARNPIEREEGPHGGSAPS